MNAEKVAYLIILGFILTVFCLGYFIGERMTIINDLEQRVQKLENLRSK